MKYSPWFTEPKEPPSTIVPEKELGDSPILQEISVELKKLVKIEEERLYIEKEILEVIKINGRENDKKGDG